MVSWGRGCSPGAPLTAAPLGPSAPQWLGSATHMLGSHPAGTRGRVCHQENSTDRQWTLLCSSQSFQNVAQCLLSSQELLTGANSPA